MNIYEQHIVALETLQDAKAEELRIRDLICGDVLQDKLEGATTREDDGFKVTANAKLTRSLDRIILESIWEDLTDLEKEAIDYKPSLKLTQYKAIEQRGGLLMDAVTVKPAQPTLKIIPMGIVE